MDRMDRMMFSNYSRMGYGNEIDQEEIELSEKILEENFYNDFKDDFDEEDLL